MSHIEISGWSGGPTVCPSPSEALAVALTVVAQRMAQPLRDAFRAHLAGHEHPGGYAHCAEAMALFDLMPAGDRGMGGLPPAWGPTAEVAYA